MGFGGDPFLQIHDECELGPISIVKNVVTLRGHSTYTNYELSQEPYLIYLDFIGSSAFYISLQSY